MKTKLFITFFLVSISFPGYSAEPSQLVKMFENTFSHSVSAIFPDLTLQVKLNENPDFMGGSFPTYHTFEISMGENTIKRIGDDSAGLVLCHELGHLLAGKPFKSNTAWMPPYMASTEARSDYYATNGCLKEFFAINPEIMEPDLSAAPQRVIKQCEYHFPSKDRTKFCVRAALAAENLLYDIWNYLGIGPATMPNFNTKARILRYDESPAQYPTLQCRLDTFLAGNFNDVQPNCF